ncbi:MAG TPA: DUF1015 family protein [Rubricoccaceae bacterium]|nr:DUF1015 family protein [Rubricoccaceae bacterium]
MATVRPFRALRPHPDHAEAVASVPYDVIDSTEARALAHGNPHSFLHVIRPEIDLPEGTDEHDEAVYEKGAENLRRFAESEVFLEEDAPAIYVYQLVMNGRAQMGLFGLVSVAEYDDETILKHEKTRPDKEDDRLRHILTQRAHAEPVMLTYRGTDDLDGLVESATEADPLYDFTAKDYVHHTIWKVDDPAAVTRAFEEVEKLYVADGHHRCAAASRAAKALPDVGGAQHFMAVLFPMEHMEILPYNRAIVHLPIGKQRFLEQLRHRFELEESYFAEPEEPGTVGLYLGDGWHLLRLPETQRDGVAATLDVARLGEFVLEPLLGITDPRTDPNIRFVGGIRGTGELERLVDDGEAEVAFSMYPTSPEELLAVSDAGELMPPKSTWFEPKLRSGLLVHRF